MAMAIARSASPAAARAKALIAGRDVEGLRRQLNAEKDAFLECARSPDFEEGVAAFLSKRPPQFGT
jgi:2-(1,2-epoxy-1,2-dihydrophenyl)acetyl-CoA isomerase